MCINKLRFKCVIKKVNTTGNPDWFHYEKHWKLQQETDKGWLDVPDVYFLEDENGERIEISKEEYLKLNKIK